MANASAWPPVSHNYRPVGLKVSVDRDLGLLPAVGDRRSQSASRQHRRPSVCWPRDNADIKHISAVLSHAPSQPPALPAPRDLSPPGATALGSQLLAGGADDRALPYLLRGLAETPTAFGWCRVGKVCRRLGRADDAVRCYDRALQLEPNSRHAVVARAAALGESDTAPLPRLVTTLGELYRMLGSEDPRPIAWTAYSLMRGIARRWAHPSVRRWSSRPIRQHTRGLSSFRWPVPLDLGDEGRFVRVRIGKCYSLR